MKIIKLFLLLNLSVFMLSSTAEAVIDMYKEDVVFQNCTKLKYNLLLQEAASAFGNLAVGTKAYYEGPNFVTLFYLYDPTPTSEFDAAITLNPQFCYHDTRPKPVLPDQPPEIITSQTKPKDPTPSICKVGGSVIDPQNKTVSEKIPIEGTSLELNYSSVFNNNIAKNRTIENRFTLLRYISADYVVRIFGSDNSLLDTMNYAAFPPFSFGADYLVPASSPIWINNDFKSTARVTANLVSLDEFPPDCEFVSYTDQDGVKKWRRSCTLPQKVEFVEDSAERSIVLYHPEVWGLNGWTVSEHHYFDRDSLTFFSGLGERVKYSSFKSVNDASLGLVDVLLNKSNENELFIFDQQGRHLETRDAIQGYVINKFSYDSSNKLISISDRFGSNTNFVYNGGVISKIVSPYGVETSFEVISGQILKATDPEGFSYEMTYDALGLLKTYTSISGVVTQFIYDSAGGFVREEKNIGLIQYFTQTIIDGGIEILHNMNFGVAQKIHSVATMYGLETRQLDKDDNIISRNLQSYTSNISVMAYNQDSFSYEFSPSADWPGDKINISKSVKTVTESGQNITDSINFSENRTYIDNNVLSLQSYQKSASKLGLEISKASYDKISNTQTSVNELGAQTKLFYNSDGLIIQINESGKYSTYLEYDIHGRTKKVQKGQQFEAFAYDSNGYLSSISNHKGQQTQYVRNKKGQILTKILPNLDKIYYKYTSDGAIEKIIAPNGQVHNFQLSLGDYVTHAVSPNSKVTNYDYDSNKRLSLVTKPSGKTINYEYEEGRSDLKRIVTTDGNITINSKDVRSRIKSITSADGIRSDFTWASDRIQSESWYDNGELVAKLSYTFATDKFLVSSIHLNETLIADYSYSNNGVLQSIINLGFKYSRKLTSDEHELKITDSRKINISYSENDNLNGEKPTKVNSLQVVDNSQAQLFVTLMRSFDFLGQATEFSMATLNQGSNVYNSYNSMVPEYDANNRLTKLSKLKKSYVGSQEVASVDHYNQYTYLPGSNNNSKTFEQYLNSSQEPSKRTTATINIDDQLTKLQGSVNRDYKYNEDGELSEMTNCYGTTRYSYDSQGNLKKVEFPDGRIIEYKIDAFNRRFKKIVNGQTKEYYIWYDKTRLAAVLDANKNPKLLYVYGDEAQYAPGYLIKDGKTYKIIHDPGSESVRYIVDPETAMVVQEIEYDEYGNILKNTNPAIQPLGFNGGLYDLDTKFVRFGARDYDPTIGRWTTKDPIGFAGGDTNLYAYVGGNPMSYVDPTGLDRRKCSRRLNSLFTPIKAGRLRHDYVQFRDSKGNIVSRSWGDKGMIDESKIDTDTRKCEDWKTSSDKADANAMRYGDNLASAMEYDLTDYNCQNWSEQVIHYQEGK